MSVFLLVAVSALAGLTVALAFRFTANLEALRATRKRMQAHLLEFRLFFDEPGLIWKAQVALLRDNLRLAGLLLAPALALALPLTWGMAQLDSAYGFRPLAAGEATVVTAQFHNDLRAGVELQGASGVAVETPPVRIAQDRQISWRIRANAGPGTVRLLAGGETIDKTVAAGMSMASLSRRRSRSLPAYLMHPFEARLPAGDVDWVEVDYPARREGISWMVWFLLISTSSAWLFARTMKVTF